MKLDRPLFFDGSKFGITESLRVLEFGDPEAMYPIGQPGQEIPEAVVQRYRLVQDAEGRVQQAPEVAPVVEAEAPAPRKRKAAVEDE